MAWNLPGFSKFGKILFMHKIILVLFISVLFFMINNQNGYGQVKKKVLDPSGYVTKYNPAFRGIGPPVYVLPAPRTKEEMLVDTYKEIGSFQDSIDQAMVYRRMSASIKATSNLGLLSNLINPVPANELAWNTLIEKNITSQNFGLAYGLLNEYAQSALQNKAIRKAITLLERALPYAERHGNTHDMGIIQSNLSSLLIYDKKYVDAGKYEEAYYQQALKNKSLIEQGESLVKIAQIQAEDKDYRSSENTIIRKAIPLFNKSKHYEGKILAWQQLARIYYAQNKHTESQWFLIQARDLANAKSFPHELAEIEYMLASSKYIQKNFRVAKKELDNANVLAQKEDDKLLRLAIVEKLGLINMIQQNIDDAAENLLEYWTLRNELF